MGDVDGAERKQTLLNSLSVNVSRLLRAFLLGFGVNGTVDPEGIRELISTTVIALGGVSVLRGMYDLVRLETGKQCFM